MTEDIRKTEAAECKRLDELRRTELDCDSCTADGWAVEGNFCRGELVSVTGGERERWCQRLAMAIATGDPFLGRYEVERSAVVYLSDRPCVEWQASLVEWTRTEGRLQVYCQDEVLSNARFLRGKPGVVILDRARRPLDVMAENELIARCDEFIRHTGWSVLVSYERRTVRPDCSPVEVGSDTCIEVSDNGDLGVIARCLKQGNDRPSDAYVVP